MASERKQMTTEEKELVFSMHKQGISARKIAEIFQRHHSCIDRILKRKQAPVMKENPVKRGCCSKVSARDERHLGRLVRTDRRQTLSDITAEFNQGREASKVCAKRTVQRHLHKLGFSKRTVRKTIIIKEQNRRLRMQWARSKLIWDIENWKDIIFSDEMMIVLRADNGHIKVWRRVGERWRPECLGVVRNRPTRTLKIMVWGCLSYFGVGELAFVDGNMNSRKYIDVLDNYLWPTVHSIFGDERWVLQEDNATIHKSRETTEYKTETNITVLRWPAQSPDLNIIENVWLVMKKHVRKRSHLINSVDDLKRELLTAWKNVSQLFIRRLYESIPRRLRAVLTQHGHITKY
jgi:transposase